MRVATTPTPTAKERNPVQYTEAEKQAAAAWLRCFVAENPGKKILITADGIFAV